MFGTSGFDPSRLSPELLAKMSALIQELPPEQIQKMQRIMHNMMAGFDVKKETEEFEKALPPSFKERMTALALQAQLSSAQTFGSGSNPVESSPAPHPQSMVGGPAPGSPPASIDEARLTILQGVASGQVTPEEALKLLFE